jgi:hypothetical protein
MKLIVTADDFGLPAGINKDFSVVFSTWRDHNLNVSEPPEDNIPGIPNPNVLEF